MPTVRKRNRILTVEKQQLDGYLKRGYDQVDDNGDIVKRATGGKNVSIAAYNELLDKVQKQSSNEDIEKKVKELEEQLKEYKDDYEAVEADNERLNKENRELKKRLNGKAKNS